MIGVGICVGDANGLFGRVKPFLVNVANCGLDNIVFARVRFFRPDMVHALAADADISDSDAIIGAKDASGGRGLGLAIDGCFDESGRGDAGGEPGGLFDEVAASFMGGGIRILVIHKFDGGDDGALRLRILFGSGEIIRGGSRIQDCESADQGVDS